LARTISFISPKGGVGKTTAAVLLASEFANQGLKVTIVDADPNYPVLAWSKLAKLPSKLKITSEVDEDDIIDVIEAAKKKSQVVIVDLEGRATARAMSSLLVSDLAVVPIQGSVLDANQALKGFKSIKTAGKGRAKPIRSVALLTRTAAHDRLWSRQLRQLRGNLDKAGIEIIPTSLAERSAFKDLFGLGGTLKDMNPKEVSSLENAQKNALEYAHDVLTILNDEKG